MERTFENSTGINSNSAYDKKRLAELCRMAMGNRSILQFSKDCGLSQSFLSRVLNQKLTSRPSRRSLMKLTDPDANPNNVTHRDVMAAAGYELTESLPESEPIVESTPLPSESITFCQSVLDYFSLLSPTQVMGMLVDALITKGVNRNLTIHLHPGYCEVKEPKGKLTYVGISAFCKDETAVKIMKFALMYLFADGNSIPWDFSEDKLYYIMTDNMTLFNACPKLEFRGFRGKRLAVLYADKNGKFKQECWIMPEHKPSDVFPECLVENGCFSETE